MRAVVQRVSRAEVRVEGSVVGKIERGLVVLVGIEASDTDADLAFMVRKLPKMRIFSDDAGKMNHSVADIGGALLLVSQFTLCADTDKGARPSFVRAMEPEAANAMFKRLVAQLSAFVPVETGRFQAMMEVDLVNDGPVTVVLESQKRTPQKGGSK